MFGRFPSAEYPVGGLSPRGLPRFSLHPASAATPFLLRNCRSSMRHERDPLREQFEYAIWTMKAELRRNPPFGANEERLFQVWHDFLLQFCISWWEEQGKPTQQLTRKRELIREVHFLVFHAQEGRVDAKYLLVGTLVVIKSSPLNRNVLIPYGCSRISSAIPSLLNSLQLSAATPPLLAIS